MYSDPIYMRVITSDDKRFIASTAKITHKFGPKSYIFTEAFRPNNIWILTRGDIKSIKTAKYQVRYDTFKIF